MASETILVNYSCYNILGFEEKEKVKVKVAKV
jgi:hypothetical protein